MPVLINTGVWDHTTAQNVLVWCLLFKLLIWICVQYCVHVSDQRDVCQMKKQSSCSCFHSAFNNSEFSLHRPVVAVWLTLHASMKTEDQTCAKEQLHRLTQTHAVLCVTRRLCPLPVFNSVDVFCIPVSRGWKKGKKRRKPKSFSIETMGTGLKCP